MPAYIYKAKKDTAQTITGQINAQNEDEALEMIHQLGLMPVSIAEQTSQGQLVRDIRASKVSPKDLYTFSRQLASLIKSGVVLLKALELISQQTRQAYFSKVVTDIAFAVKGGRSFSSSLADYPAIFSPLYIAMVKAGEEMGHLGEMLNRINDFQKAQEELFAKIRAALVYPALMLAVGTVTIAFILIFVMPKIAVIFTDVGQRLPWPTAVVISVSYVLRSLWMPLVIVLALGVIVFQRWRVTALGRIAIGYFLLQLPLVKHLVIKTDLTRFCRTVHLLLASGLPLVRAIDVAVGVIHNPQLKRDFLYCVQALTAGETLGTSLQHSHLVPPLMVQLVTIGEESGSLNQALNDMADSYTQDLEEMTRMMTTLLEPLMILLVGGVVGFIVFAMLLPIFSMDILAH